MQAQKTQRNMVVNNLTQRLIAVAIIMLFLFVIGLYINNAVKAYLSQARSSGITTISQADLEEKYGLDVNLVAVTAAGGMIDLRLQMTDGEKAKALLADQANFPVLRTANGVVLHTTPELSSQPINFENSNPIIALYPNSHKSVNRGDPVTIAFGNLQVEATLVK